MNTAMPQEHCPECGTPLTPGAAQGLCARCLMAGAAAATDQAAPRSAPPTLEQVAAAFPQFEVIELIGRGGMGAVYKVRQPKLDRFAALKLLPQSLGTDPAFASRFEREARLLARLNHANIVAVYDHGQAGEFFYLLMEHVDGVNLRQAMRATRSAGSGQGRFTPAQALGVVPKICEALQYAHDEGVLHRDIKPENILLDAKGRVKLADFGIAKLIAESDPASAGTSAKDPTLTHAGAALGTPQYMAPEQRETPADVDHRADIYSLGVVFYELLTGELPVGKFAPPSERSTADPRVDGIVRQAMEMKRDRRQHSAEEMRTQVQTVAESGARPPAPPQISPTRKTFRSRLRRAVLAGGALLLLGGLVLFGLDGLLPQVYFAKVTIQIKPEEPPPLFPLDPVEGEIHFQKFSATQFQIIRSSEFINEVIERLGTYAAGTKPIPSSSQQTIFRRLLSGLDLRTLKNTGLVEIGVYSDDPERAANVANTIAVVYQQKRLNEFYKRDDQRINKIKEDDEKYREIATDALAKLEAIKERDGIVDEHPEAMIPGSASSRSDSDLNPYFQAKARLIEAKRVSEAARVRYWTEVLQRGIDFDPAKIWEKAEPAIAPRRFSLYRLRHAFAR